MVNTFILTSNNFDPDYLINASLLDNKRLGKQRVEAKQILDIILNLKCIAKYYNWDIINDVNEDELKLPINQQIQMFINRCNWVDTIRKRYLALNERLIYRKINENFKLVKYDNSIIKYLNLLKEEKIISLGFSGHPAVKMWIGYTDSLKLYINSCISIWLDRKFKNNMEIEEIKNLKIISPWWREYNNSPIILSHFSSLIKKDSYYTSNKNEIFDKFNNDYKEWLEYGYSWPSKIDNIFYESLFQGVYLHPSYVTQ